MDTIYNTAQDEFSIEDENGKSRLIYAYFGLAIYFAQCLEETLSILLWTNKVFKNKVKTNREVNEIIDDSEISKKPMGILLNEVKRVYELSDDQILSSQSILNERNYLVHRYFKINVQKFYSSQGQLEMLKYFCDFIGKSQHIDEELKFHYKIYTDKLGLTEEEITAIMEDMIKQEVQKEAH